MLTRLKPTAIGDQLDTLPDQVGRADLNLREALTTLCTAEVARKDERRIQMGMSIAKFPCVRTLEGFGYDAQPWLISRRHERGSMLVTSNRSVAEWGDVFGDAVAATAILDQLLHHSHVITIRGDSYRLRTPQRTDHQPGVRSRCRQGVSSGCRLTPPKTRVPSLLFAG